MSLNHIVFTVHVDVKYGWLYCHSKKNKFTGVFGISRM